MEKKRVAVIYGGRSGEHAISCATASGVLGALDRDRYEVISVGITKDGVWVPGVENPADLALTQQADTEVKYEGKRLVCGPHPARRGGQWLVIENEQVVADLGSVDVILPLLHGPFGEDGTMQGLFELLDAKYVGSGVLASAAGMDKETARIIFANAGLQVVPAVVIDEIGWQTERDRLLADCQSLNLPLFVKPARAGSSLGISKVTDYADLPAAILKAREVDPKVLVEQGAQGKEVEVAVLGGKTGEPAHAALPGCLVFEENTDFYDFDAKYRQTVKMHLEIPAKFSKSTLAEVQNQAIKAFRALGCEGISRVDFYVEETPEGANIIINEINTMPGFTPFSMYPQAWEKSGLGYGQIIDQLIDLALCRPVGLR